MRAQTLFEARPIVFDSVLRLGTSGSTDVYGLIQYPSLAAKVFEHPSVSLARKLAFMVANVPSNLSDEDRSYSISWPVDILLRAVENGTNVGGMIMPRAINSFLMADCYNAEKRQELFPAFTYRSLHKVARNLAAAYSALHGSENEIRIGYAKESHFLVSPNMQVTVVGSDCLQIRDNQAGLLFKSSGNNLDLLAPELQGLSSSQFDFEKEHDYFSLAVVIFKLLMEGTHPFCGKGHEQGDAKLLPKRILTGQFGFGPKNTEAEVISSTPAFANLDQRLQELFITCFVDGHKTAESRPSPEMWMSALDEAAKSLQVCRTNRLHHYSNHVEDCPWSRQQRKKEELIPSQVVNPKRVWILEKTTML